MNEEKGSDMTDSKLKTTFAVFVIFVLLATVAVVFLGIEMPAQQQQQSSQEKKQQQGSDISSSYLPASKLTGLVEELENQGSSFLEKTTTINESQKEDLVSNHFSELNCEQLSDIASSFEDGWGRALAEFSTRCESNDDADIEEQVMSLVK